MSQSPKKKKPARWEYLNELDGISVDNTPVREGLRKPAHWEIFLYTVAVILWGASLYALLAEKVGATGFLLLGGGALLLRTLLFELDRRRRCKVAILGTVESFTRPRRFRTNARYPVIRFEVNGKSYLAHGAKSVHPSTKGNEEWVRYNPADPFDCFVASDSKLKKALLLAAAAIFLGVAFLILEAS